LNQQPPQPPFGPPSYGPPQYGGPPVPPYGLPPQRPKRKTGKILFLSIGGFIVLILLIAVATSAGHPSSSAPGAGNSPAAGANQAVSQPTTQAPTTPAPTPSPAQSTVEYIVSGNAPSGDISPTVTYGPDGSDTSGTVPLDVTQPIPSSAPDYYAITVQLSDAGGNVTCEIKVNGQVIDQESAQGAFQIASCEISQDPFSGQWQNTNSGG
jgi:hypothetical protein